LRTVTKHSPLSFPTPQAFTISLWVRTSHHHTNTKTVLSYVTPGNANGAGYQELALVLDPTSANVLIHGEVNEAGEGTLRTGLTFDDGEWHFVAFTWRSADGRVQAFKDGALSYLAGGYRTGVTLASGGSLMAGQLQASACSTGSNGAALCSYSGGFGFDGELQNVRVWGRELSNTELLHGLQWPFAGSQVRYSWLLLPNTASCNETLTPSSPLPLSPLFPSYPLLFPRSTCCSTGDSSRINTTSAQAPSLIFRARESH
jgi:hypothetical protein